MSVIGCIQRAIDAGEISASKAREAQQVLAARIADYAHLGPEGAEAAALADVKRHIERQTQEAKRRTVLQARANIRNGQALAEHRTSDGRANAADGFFQFIEWGGSAKFQNVKATADALESSYILGIGKAVEKHSLDIFGGVRSKALMRDWLNELHGKASHSPAAKQVADAIRETLERARINFNAAGGSIGKLEHYMPQAWERSLIEKAGFEAWSAEMMPRLAWDRITDYATSQPFSKSSDAARLEFLEGVYETITQRGWNKRQPMGVQAGRSVANSRNEHRVLHFKSADAWYEVNEQFGRADPFSTVVAHLKSMARDTASMQVYGPNPKAGFEFLAQSTIKQANTAPWELSKLARARYSSAAAEAEGRVKHARRMWDLYTGAANKVESDVVASAFSGLRHFLVASQLGGAMLSAVSDSGFIAAASNHVGMDWKKVIGRQLRAVASSEERALMVRAGIIADSAANVGVAQARFMGDDHAKPLMQRFSEFTMRASGLTAWTDIGRGVFRLEFYGFLGDNAGRQFGDLPPELRKLMEDRGFTSDEWDVIRQTELFRDEAEPDASFLVPSDIQHRTDLDPNEALRLSLKLDAFVLEQVEFAVPSASLRGQAAFDFGNPGTISGELLKSGLMYKAFPLSIVFNQLGRVLFHRVNGSRIGNIAMFGTMTTAMGALSIQLKEMAKGRDPRPMDNTEFLMAAILQGGGLGIFGDFAASTQNRFGGGLSTTLAGPAVGFVNDGGGLIGRGVAALTGGEKERDQFGRALTKFLNQYSGPSSLWYVNLPLDRALWDNLQELVDGEAQQAFRREEMRRRRDYGNRAYWPRGEPVPERLPELMRALGVEND